MNCQRIHIMPKIYWKLSSPSASASTSTATIISLCVCSFRALAVIGISPWLFSLVRCAFGWIYRWFGGCELAAIEACSMACVFVVAPRWIANVSERNMLAGLLRAHNVLRYHIVSIFIILLYYSFNISNTVWLSFFSMCSPFKWMRTQTHTARSSAWTEKMHHMRFSRVQTTPLNPSMLWPGVCGTLTKRELNCVHCLQQWAAHGGTTMPLSMCERVVDVVGWSLYWLLCILLCASILRAYSKPY